MMPTEPRAVRILRLETVRDVRRLINFEQFG
jgi:hypothetical protein